MLVGRARANWAYTAEFLEGSGTGGSGTSEEAPRERSQRLYGVRRPSVWHEAWQLHRVLGTMWGEEGTPLAAARWSRRGAGEGTNPREEGGCRTDARTDD